MKTHTSHHHGIIGTHVVREHERLVYTTISIKDTEAHTIQRQALRLVYAEMLLAGAGTYSREQFLDTQAKLGSDIQVRADADSIDIVVRSLDTSLISTLTLVKAMCTKPLFLATELKRVRTHLSNALVLSKEDARMRAMQNFVSLLTAQDDPRYVFPIDDIIKAIHTVTTSDLKKMHNAVLKSNWIFSCGGTKKNCVIVEKMLTSVHEHTVTPSKNEDIRHTKQQQKTKLTLIDIPHKQNIEFSIGNAIPLLRTQPDFPAFVFGMSVLGIQGGFSGRLMSTVREKEGLTYGIYALIEGITKTDEGFWRIMTFFNPKDATKGITSTLREIAHIYEKGITHDELKRFKAILHTRYTLIEDSLMKKVREVQGLHESGMTEEEFETFKTAIQNLTVLQVNTALKKYINPQALVISGAGPIQSVKKELEKFGK